MTDNKVAKRYAKSLIELAQEQNVLDAVHRDMQLVIDVCRANRDFRTMLKNPLITPDKKLAILKKTFGSSFNKLSIAFLDIITRKRREFYTDNIASEFVTQFQTLKGITKAVVVSAVGLDEKLKSEITQIVKQLAKSEVALEESVNPDIIGGFILRFGDVQYDTSIARSLRMFKTNFNKNLFESKLWKK